MRTREHKTLSFLEINARARQHFACALFQEQLQALQLKGLIAPQGGFGYVHSQRGASAARDDEYPDTVSGSSLLFDDFLKPAYRAIS